MNDEKKAALINFIQRELRHAYCDNCQGNEEEDFEECEFCHRKHIGWEISLPTATRIAEKAAQIFSEKEVI